MRRSGNTIIFVGNLPGDMRRSEVEDLFAKYGHIVDIDLKLPPRPPGFCFIEFEEPVEAADAIKGRNGYEFDGRRLRVEWARGSQRSPPPRREFTAPSNGGGGGSIRRSDYRVVVEGLPSRASWQDLKDHMRRAGDVCFVDVHRSQRGTVGVVEYTNHSDMKYAIRKLHDSEFKNPFGKGFISVREDRRSPRGRSYTPSPRSRSRSYSRSLSPRRSYSRGRSYSRSLSRSPRSRSPRGRSLSPGRSPIRGRHPIGSRSPVRRSRSRSVDSLGDRNGKLKSPVRSRSRSPSVVKDKKVSRSLSRSRSISPLPPRRRSISRSPSRSPKRARYSNSRSRSPP